MLNILVTQFSLANFAGSELFTRDLVANLKQRGHKVTVYSPLLGAVSDLIQETGVEVADKFDQLEGKKFDLIHAQHNVTAILARHYFPKVPMVMMVHGLLPFLEQPPSVEIGINAFIAVSEEVKEHLVSKGISREKIHIVRNWVDTNRFQFTPPSKKLKKVLVLSNHYLEPQRSLLEAVCKNMQLELYHIGIPENPVENSHDFIQDSDLVVTIGRGVLEASACGKNVLIWDMHGADGILTKDNYLELRKKNFSGRTHRIEFNETTLLAEFAKYNPTNGTELSKIISNQHGANVWDSIEGIYQNITNSKTPVPKQNLSILEVEFLLEEMKNRGIIAAGNLAKKSAELEEIKLKDKLVSESIDTKSAELNEISAQLAAANNELASYRKLKQTKAWKLLKGVARLTRFRP